MAIYFRLYERPLARKNGAIETFIGVRCDKGDQKTLSAALGQIDGLSFINGLKKAADAGRGEIEMYFADLGPWPDDILAYGVDRLRARLIELGFVDRSDDPA